MSSSGYTKADIAALKAIPSNERFEGLSWLVKQNPHKLPSWYTWIAANTSLADDDAVVIPADNPSEGRFLKADAIRHEVLSSDRTYYVSAFGDNTSDGLTPETSFATIQKFIDTITSIDLNGFNIDCQVIPSTYNQSIKLKSIKTNGGIVIIDGGDSSNTIIQTTSDCVLGKNVESPLLLRNLMLDSSNGNCAQLYKCNDIKFDNCKFGEANLSHIRSIGSKVIVNDCDISGNADHFVWCSNSNIQVSTLSGGRIVSDIAFEDCVLKADSNSRIAYNAIYTGSVTGIRYKLFDESIIDLDVSLEALLGDALGVVQSSQIIVGYRSATHLKNLPIDDSAKAAGKVLKLNEDGDRIVYGDTPYGGAIAISDEDTFLTAAATSINFTGSGVAATNANGAVTVTIPGTTSTSVDLEAIDDRVAALLQPGAGIGLTYDDAANSLTISSTVSGSGIAAGRELLTADRAYYVSPTGSDSNTGLTSNTAFQTIQKAVNLAASLDLSIYDLTIQLADGTYHGAVALKGLVGSGKVIIQGNSTTPSNVLVSSETSNSFTFASKSGLYLIKDLKITNTGAIAIYAKGGASIQFSNIDFASCGRHLVAHQGGLVESVGNYLVSGGAINHMTVWDNGIMQNDSKTITFNTNPTNFSGEYLYCNTGVAIVFGCTFINFGYVTGKKFTIEQNGVINGGGSVNYLPGTTSGSTATGGQYV